MDKKVIKLGNASIIGATAKEKKMDKQKLDTLNVQVAAAFERGGPDAAISDLSKAIESDPRFSQFSGTYCIRGQLNFQFLKDNKAAIDDLNRAIELDPDDAEIYSARGFIYGQTGDIDAAVKDFEKSVGLAPTIAACSTLARYYHDKCKKCLTAHDDGGYLKNIDRSIEILDKGLNITSVNAEETALQSNMWGMRDHARREREHRKNVFDGV